VIKEGNLFGWRSAGFGGGLPGRSIGGLCRLGGGKRRWLSRRLYQKILDNYRRSARLQDKKDEEEAECDSDGDTHHHNSTCFPAKAKNTFALSIYLSISLTIRAIKGHLRCWTPGRLIGWKQRRLRGWLRDKKRFVGGNKRDGAQ
jgi:hypothetical protein